MPDPETRTIRVDLTPAEAAALAKAVVVVTSAAETPFIRAAERALTKCQRAARTP